MELLFIAAAITIGVYLVYTSTTGNGSGQVDSVGDLGDFVDTSANPVTVRVAQAIASAEGFYVAGSRPARNHNPGDMTADLISRAVGRDGIFVVYSNDEDGWNNLYAQINAWLNGTSHHATSDSTISQIAAFYTTTQQDSWAQNVANYLGVSPDTSIGSLA